MFYAPELFAALDRDRVERVRAAMRRQKASSKGEGERQRAGGRGPRRAGGRYRIDLRDGRRLACQYDEATATATVTHSTRRADETPRDAR